MSDRLQQALDGELAIADLTPDECAELHRYRAAICTALDPIQRLSPVDVSPEVMQRIRPGRIRRALGALRRGLWSPRAFVFRPAYGLAGAVALAATLWISSSTRDPGGQAVPPRVVVQFRVSQLQAHEVALVGDFNGWRPEHHLRRNPNGVWSVDVALEPGVYNYVFLVDGTTLRLDPLAPTVMDGFGGASSRVTVFTPGPQS
jgi:Glycogen recognition site of AMP-activated protein kinase